MLYVAGNSKRPVWEMAARGEAPLNIAMGVVVVAPEERAGWQDEDEEGMNGSPCCKRRERFASLCMLNIS
jgi:hypothetical protein